MTRRVELDGGLMRTIREAHAHIARMLEFPDYYGGNLDALWDELSAIGEPCHIRINNASSVREQLGEYGDRLIHTFLDASETNHQCMIELIG